MICNYFKSTLLVFHEISIFIFSIKIGKIFKSKKKKKKWNKSEFLQILLRI